MYAICFCVLVHTGEITVVTAVLTVIDDYMGWGRPFNSVSQISKAPKGTQLSVLLVPRRFQVAAHGDSQNNHPAHHHICSTSFRSDKEPCLGHKSKSLSPDHETLGLQRNPRFQLGVGKHHTVHQSRLTTTLCKSHHLLLCGSSRNNSLPQQILRVLELNF